MDDMDSRTWRVSAMMSNGRTEVAEPFSEFAVERFRQIMTMPPCPPAFVEIMDKHGRCYGFNTSEVVNYSVVCLTPYVPKPQVAT
jgi:hypothetical protein